MMVRLLFNVCVFLFLVLAAIFVSSCQGPSQVSSQDAYKKVEEAFANVASMTESTAFPRELVLKKGTNGVDVMKIRINTSKAEVDITSIPVEIRMDTPVEYLALIDPNGYIVGQHKGLPEKLGTGHYRYTISVNMSIQSHYSKDFTLRVNIPTGLGAKSMDIEVHAKDIKSNAEFLSYTAKQHVTLE